VKFSFFATNQNPAPRSFAIRETSSREDFAEGDPLIAPVHIILSLRCGEQKRQNPASHEMLGNHR
jgi:hypothetical protein